MIVLNVWKIVLYVRMIVIVFQIVELIGGVLTQSLWLLFACVVVVAVVVVFDFWVVVVDMIYFDVGVVAFDIVAVDILLIVVV